MKILFLGYAVNDRLQGTLSGISVAGNKMQVNILKELGRREDVEVESITVLPLASFPREKRIFVNKETINVVEGVDSVVVPYINIPLIKQLSQTISVYRQAKRMVTEDTVVFSFNLFPQVGIPLMRLKKKGYKNCALIADLPIDDNKNRNPIRKFFRHIFEKKTIKALKACDKLIVLNKHALDYFKLNTPYIVVEGGVDSDLKSDIDKVVSIESRNIVYSGALSEYSGIRTLVESMKYVSEGIVLQIYGGGYLTEEIKSIAKERSNIEYMGSVTNSEMLEIQKKAYCLVNPRPTTDLIAQVTFPSKMFEYMMSGRPVITSKLNGLNNEYLDHLFVFNEETPQAFAEKINEVFELPEKEIVELAIGAKNFIEKKKNWKVQVDRIIEFLLL